MWTWSLNWGEITPALVIGTCPMTPDDLRVIHARTGVSAVVSVQHDDCLAYWGIDYAEMCRTGAALGLAMARCPIRDFDIDDMRRRLPDAVATLARIQAGGHRTYVHCTAGLGRAPLTVLGLLTLVDGYGPEEAIQVIHKGRVEAVPAWEAYHGCCEDLVARHRLAIAQRAFSLFQQGKHGQADHDWFEAQADVLRAALLRRDSSRFVTVQAA